MKTTYFLYEKKDYDLFFLKMQFSGKIWLQICALKFLKKMLVIYLNSVQVSNFWEIFAGLHMALPAQCLGKFS